MLALQRHRGILELVESAGAVRVAELARRFRVTEETIRRDLEKMETDGRLLRTHGGAVPMEDPLLDRPFRARETVAAQEKAAIAAWTAERHIEPGDAIALDASSSAYQLARALPNAPLTVLTNSLEAAAFLAARPAVRVISTGGTLDPHDRAFTGPLAEDAARRYHVDKLFLSARGVDPARGLSEADESHARIKETLIEQAERVFLLADHTKMGVKSRVFFARLDALDAIVTDDGTPQEMQDALAAAGCALEVVQ